MKKIKKPTEQEQTASDADITPVERDILDNMNINTDDELLRRAQPDATDEEGELLNENTLFRNFSGNDLDIPGSEEDDENEEIGEEDEENNSYSQADTE